MNNQAKGYTLIFFGVGFMAFAIVAFIRNFIA